MSPVHTLILTIAIVIVVLVYPLDAALHYSKHSSTCPPVSGSFNISSFRLYPENVDWDFFHCKLYSGSLFNATVLIYDPYDGSQNIIEFPGISYNSSFHITGVDFDFFSGDMYFTASNPLPWENPFDLGGDLVGPNYLIRFNTATLETVYIASLAPAQAEAQAITGFFAAGFQDQSEDDRGNSYSTAAFGNIIAKIDSQGTASLFYATPATEIQPKKVGFAGIVTIGSSKLLVPDGATGTLAAFDTTLNTPTRQNVPIEGAPANYTIGCDGLLAPFRYNEKVLLCSDDFTSPDGAIRVFGSNDYWATAKYLGEILNDGVDSEGSEPTATVEISESIFISLSYSFDAGGTIAAPGNRTEFPFVDITAKVDSLVKAGLEMEN